KPNHNRRVPKRSIRNSFDKKTRDKIFEDENNCCQSCGDKATQIHHVMPRSRGGRGVYTNGMAVCNSCHTVIHKNNKVLKHWQKLYEFVHGKDYYKDEWD